MTSVGSTDESFALEVVILTHHPVTLNANGARCGAAQK